MAGPACAGPLGQIEPTIATVDDTAVPDRLSISCHLLAVQIGCSLSAQQVPLCLTLQRVSRPFLRVTFFKASWAGIADSRRRRRQYLFSGAMSAPPQQLPSFSESPRSTLLRSKFPIVQDEKEIDGRRSIVHKVQIDNTAR